MDAISQADIDRLLGAAVGAGAFAGPAAGPARAAPAPRATAVPDPDAQPYDFRRPHRVSRERLRTLEAMYERMVKGLEQWLVSRLRGHVELRLQSVEQFAFGEFVMSLPAPCASYVFDVRHSGGPRA
jgi:flagellar motor switch protein FliM